MENGSLWGMYRLEVNFGSQLRAYRKMRGLTQAQLAGRSGVVLRSIIYWEQGVHAPGLGELQSLSDALNLDREERQTLLSFLSPGKVSKIVRGTTLWTDIAPPGVGDLIRALRWRQRLTRNQVARALCVHHTTVMRWEEARTVPNAEARLRLCDALNALPEERTVLLTAPHAAPLWDGNALTLDACRAEAARLERGCGREADPLFDLSAYLLTGTLWNLTPREAEARLVLAQTYAARAVYSCLRGDDGAALDYSGRSLDLLAGEKSPPKGTLYLALWAGGQALAYRSPHAGPGQNLRQNKRWLLQLGPDRAPAFLLMNAAWWALKSGSLREARDYWQAANARAERSKTISVHVREGIQSLHVGLLVGEGRYEEALAVDMQIVGASYQHPIMRHLFQSFVFLKMGARNDADSHLRQAYALIAERQADFYAKEADALAKQLERNA